VYFILGKPDMFHNLLCYNLNKSFPQAQGGELPNFPKSSETSFHVRNVERGTKIVMCNRTRSYIQMPRGNLEGIYPRVPMLYRALQLVEQAEYGIAFVMLKKNKIDLNLIYDINPEKFISNISKFIDEVPQIDNLNLFINGLNEQPSRDLEFIKPSTAENRIKKELFGDNEFDSKIIKVCDLFREELNKRNENNKMLLPILTTYIKKSP
jgi:elongator complex protein 1